MLCAAVAAALDVLAAVRVAPAASFPIARIYFEYNSSANDLGVHVPLDAEDWKNVRIVHPDAELVEYTIVP